jgi:putative sugar O-methyltransferase
VSYINFDLPESIALSTYYLKANYPDARFATISDFPVGEPLHRDRLLEYDFVLLPWWYIESLAPDTIDLFMNSASMQEMTREFIDYYIEHIQRAARGYFYWINRDMPPERYGGVQFQDYPLDDNWRTVYTTHSPIHLREWLALRS